MLTRFGRSSVTYREGYNLPGAAAPERSDLASRPSGNNVHQQAILYILNLLNLDLKTLTDVASIVY